MVTSTAPRTLASIQIDGARTRAWMFCRVTSSVAHRSLRPIAASSEAMYALTWALTSITWNSAPIAWAICSAAWRVTGPLFSVG